MLHEMNFDCFVSDVTNALFEMNVDFSLVFDEIVKFALLSGISLVGTFEVLNCSKNLC